MHKAMNVGLQAAEKSIAEDRRLYIRDFPFGTTEGDLKELLGDYKTQVPYLLQKSLFLTLPQRSYHHPLRSPQKISRSLLRLCRLLHRERSNQSANGTEIRESRG